MFEALKDGGVVVIGGTGGLGTEICKTFARIGSGVAFSYRNRAEAALALLDELRELGVSAIGRRADLGDIGTVRTLFDEAEASFGQIHTVVYASGPVVRISPIADLPPAEWAAAINADVNGFFNLLHVAIPVLRRARGSVVALSTAATQRYAPLDVLSAGPKASVELLVRGIAREEGRNGIRANCVGVGQIDAGQGLSIQQDPRGQRLAQRVLASTPLRRYGTAADVANVVLFLASPMAAFVSGESICVDGGGHV